MTDTIPELPELLGRVIAGYRSQRDSDLKELLDEADWSRPAQLMRDADDLALRVMLEATTMVTLSDDRTKEQLRAIEHEYLTHERTFWRRMFAERGIEDGHRHIESLAKEWDLDDIEEGLHSGSVLHRVWDRLCISLAFSMQERLREASKRVLLLVRQLEGTRPPKATQDFLVRVSRCYTWGFDTECVLLCRSALDTAFRDRVPDSLLEAQGFPRGKYVVLAERIEAACPSLIDEAARAAANRVRERGRKAAHYEAGPPVDVLGTIGDTTQVIAQLHPGD